MSPEKWISGPRDWALAVLACVLVAFPLAHSWIAREPRVSEIPEDFVALSMRQYQAHQFRECIESAQAALKLEPGLAIAFNNMGACYGALGLLDEAIRSDAEAVRLQPDYQLAKNNLAWALDQKRLQSVHVQK
jgi:tetratricopeptide (TPR) repeat protein